MTDLEAQISTLDLPEIRTLAPRPAWRLEFLDGIRGLAALYVVIYHAWAEMAWSYDGKSLPAVNSPWLRWLQHGHYAVVFFIVVSGYSLMLPVMRSGSVKGGWRGYFSRRSRRILPTYYAALALSLIVIIAVPGMNRTHNVRWDSSLPALAPGPIISHLLLIHNLNPAWVYRINNPMWSIATEWQIYFVFPLLLLAWRRLGNLPTIVLGWVIGLTVTKLGGSHVRPGCPWFVGLFSMGMIAAALCFKSPPKRRFPWGLMGLAIGCGIILINCLSPDTEGNHGSPFDFLVGTAAVSLLIFSFRSPHSLPTRCLGALAPLGGFSYSLYLIHSLVLSPFHLLLLHLRVDPTTSLMLLMSIGTCGSVGLSYLFYLAFERPFMSSMKQK